MIFRGEKRRVNNLLLLYVVKPWYALWVVPHHGARRRNLTVHAVARLGVDRVCKTGFEQAVLMKYGDCRRCRLVVCRLFKR